MPRKITNRVYEMIDEGLLSNELVVNACMKYMSEDDVADMAECNEFITSEEVEEIRGY